MKNFFSACSVLAVAIAFTACGPKHEPHELVVNDVTFTNDTPITEGSNTITANAAVNIAEWATANQLDPAAVSDVKLKSATIIVPDSLNLDNFETALLQVAGGKVGLSDVAIGKKGAAGTKEITFTVAKEAEIGGILTGNKDLTFVLDLNATKEEERTYTFKGKFVFEAAAAPLAKK